jgi:hypothetical protein
MQLNFTLQAAVVPLQELLLVFGVMTHHLELMFLLKPFMLALWLYTSKLYAYKDNIKIKKDHYPLIYQFLQKI